MDTPVFRHQHNKKWFAIVMTVKKSKLGIQTYNETVSIVNLKCAQEIIDSILDEYGIFPAYHMSKRHWISVLLDGSVKAQTIRFLTSVRYELTRANGKFK